MSNDKISPLDIEYFDEDIARFKDNLAKNEELYDEIHEKLVNSNAGGFSLGLSRTASEYAKTLATIRSTAISGSSQLFAAKRSIADIALKKEQLKLDKDKGETDKAFIRAAVEEIKRINTDDPKSKSTKLHELVENKDIDEYKEKIMEGIRNEVKSGKIKVSKNEEAMKYDFIGEGVETVYDNEKDEFLAVKRGTDEIIPNYPLERLSISKVVLINDEKQTAHLESGDIVRLIKS